MSVLKDGLFLKHKDSKRNFNSIVKDVLWVELIEKSQKPTCPCPGKSSKCKKWLTYEDCQVDHIYPWNKGGKAEYKNAQLLCSSCNKSMGDKIKTE